MTFQNVPRQGLLPGVTKDTRKSVSATLRPRQALVVPQKGIIVGQGWKIGADPFNVLLYRRVKSKVGKEMWEIFGYYSTLGNALIGLVRQGIRDTELEDIKAVEGKIAELEHDILKWCAGR